MPFKNWIRKIFELIYLICENYKKKKINNEINQIH